jgi:YfiH family protein
MGKTLQETAGGTGLSSMRESRNGGLPRLEFPLLAASPGLKHAIYTRSGGVSDGPFSTLNTAFDVGDDPSAVEENRRRIQGDMGGMTPVFLRQHHGTRVVCIGQGKQGAQAAKTPLYADALVTNRPGLLLVIQVADCQAVIIHDPVEQVVANVHSGWRGSVGNILGKTVAEMQHTFGCRPENLRAGIGPSLGPCCAEFIHYRDESPPSLWRYRVDGFNFDFWTMSADQLKSAGVAGRHIDAAGLCTRCRTDLFYSYRAEKTTGRFAAAAGLGGKG